MKPDFKLIGLGALSFMWNGKTVFSQPNKDSKQPNILLILADDMGYSDIGCYGSEIHTPNIDKLASEGTRFTQFYNASRCCPTRASLLTGLYQHEAGIGLMVDDMGYPSYQGYLNEHCVSLAEALKANGYDTYMSGKWHVGGAPEHWPRKRGFDRYFGLIDGASNYFKLIPYRVNQKAPRMALDDSLYTPPKDSFYMTDGITDYAIKFLTEEQPKQQPFFMYLAYTAPHWPLHALPEDIAKYRGKYMKGWDALRKERYERMTKLGIIDTTDIKLSPRDEMSFNWDTLSTDEKKMWDLRMAVYAAMIDRLDQNIGRVLKKLEEMGEKDNTVIIFMSDNGGCHEQIHNVGNYVRMPGEPGTPESLYSYEYPWANASNTPFRLFKHWVHEGGISTPFIVDYPVMVKPGTMHTDVAHIIDIMPTLLDFAHGKYPTVFHGDSITPMEGRSIIPILKDSTFRRPTPLFWEHMGNRAVRDGKWKLVSRFDEENEKFGTWELYDMTKDRSELNDLSGKYPEIVKKMAAQYEVWAKRVGVVPKPEFDANRRKAHK